MTTTTATDPIATAPLAVDVAIEPSAPPRRRFRRFLRATVALVGNLLKLTLGVVLCSTHLSSVLAVGWTFRLMRRRIVRGLWRVSPVRDAVAFETIAECFDTDLPAHALPRWIVAERPGERLNRPSSRGMPPGRVRQFVRLPSALLGGVVRNGLTGLRALICTYVLTGPACALWLGGWYDGWNNSFHKGYEQAPVGPLTCLLGIVLFVAAMSYVPMAWAHLAATGEARAFFDFRLVRALIRRRPFALFTLAALFALLAIPLSILRALPLFFTSFDPTLEEASPARVATLMGNYGLACGGVAFGAFLATHLVAARIYRSALLALLRSDPAQADRLPARLRTLLADLELIPSGPPRRRAPLAAVALGAGRRGSGLVLRVASALLWAVVAFQVFVVQFIKFEPWLGWLNQPQIHVPCLAIFPADSSPPLTPGGILPAPEIPQGLMK